MTIINKSKRIRFNIPLRPTNVQKKAEGVVFLNTVNGCAGQSKFRPLTLELTLVQIRSKIEKLCLSYFVKSRNDLKNS